MEPDVLGGDTDLLEMSVLYADDNVDHNLITLDGKGDISWKECHCFCHVWKTDKPYHSTKTDLRTKI